MTSRQAGRRMATISAQRKRQTGRSGIRQPGRRKDESMRPKERRQFLQLVICCGIFVLLVAAKFLLPSRMAQINEVLSRAMEQNMDVQAVFSAVGRAFSGESGMSGTVDEVYRAVFHPDGTEEALETSAHIPASQGIAAMAALQAYLPLGEAETAEDMQEAVQVCAVYADIGDYVLLSPACASWGMFKDYEERGRVFKECVMAL